MCYNNKYIIIISIRQYSCTKPHSFVSSCASFV